MPRNSHGSPQGKYWLLTVPYNHFVPYLPPNTVYIKGQLERSNETEYLHWQLVVVFKKKVRLGGVRAVFGNYHAELTRSDAAMDYVWKDDTAVEGTRFELGVLPMNRNDAEYWKTVKDKAKHGRLDDIEEDVYIRYYRTLKLIAKDHMVKPPDIEETCGVWIYGPPGVGKSHYARDSYPNAYMKPCNKWWDGYQEEENVIIDDLDKAHECLGHHLKIWADKYSFIAETKGCATHIRPKAIVITSNYSIAEIFGKDPVLCAALMRRFNSIFMPMRLY